MNPALSGPTSFRITVNGEARDVTSGTTLADLLVQLSIREDRVAVEVNLDVIRRGERSLRVLVEGDRVEVVSFVGGGA